VGLIVYLDKDDELVLSGEYGETKAKMMEILVALGKVFGAERMISIRSAQVSGASYKTIGEWGLKWLQSLDARVAVPTVLNPVGMDRMRWREMGIEPGFAQKQQEVIDAYSRLGVKMECTCTPYYLHITSYGDHLAWSESSAVAYANSVIGARTNREGGPSALAAAIIGKTPEFGLHLVKNRQPQVAIEVSGMESDDETAFYGALGYYAGKCVGNKIPVFSGIRPKRDHLKAMGAAMAATGAVALFHVDGITPESRIFRYDVSGLEKITVDRDDIVKIFEDVPVDAVAIGCPHCSPEELSRIADLLSGRTVKIPVYIFASRGVIGKNPDPVRGIEQSGARVYADTCMVVSPVMEQYRTIMVNSGKAFAYVPNMCGAAVRIGTLEECIDAAT
jgi:predicted aconitase